VERKKGKFTPRHCRLRSGLQSRVLLFHSAQEPSSALRNFPMCCTKAAVRWVPPPAQLLDLLSTTSFYHDSFCVSLISPTCYFVINCTEMVKQAREGKGREGKQKTFALSVAGIPPCSTEGAGLLSHSSLTPAASLRQKVAQSWEILDCTPPSRSKLKMWCHSLREGPFKPQRSIQEPLSSSTDRAGPRALDFRCFALFLNSSVRPRSRLERLQ
jgi:hypothetical protein